MRSAVWSALGTAVCAQHWAPLFDEMRMFDVISFSAAISACEKDGQCPTVAVCGDNPRQDDTGG
eukprot:3490118-Karenia_brevis.AAC.1